MSDLDKLEELAKAATLGPWESDGATESKYYQTEDTFITSSEAVIAQTFNRLDEDYPNYGANARYIAAANPQTVLEMIAELRQLRNDWIPVTSSGILPPSYRDVLVQLSNDPTSITVMYYSDIDSVWYFDEDSYLEDSPVAWQPLPQPYEASDER